MFIVLLSVYFLFLIIIMARRKGSVANKHTIHVYCITRIRHSRKKLLEGSVLCFKKTLFRGL